MQKTIQRPFLVDMMSARQRRIFRILVGVWIISVIFYFHWWFAYHHVITWARYIINSLLIGWTLVIPGYYFYFVGRMKRANPEIRLPDSWSVAMVVTKAPSEPFPVVKKTLLAMLSQVYPHDTWLADEDPAPEVIIWCRNHNVAISTRKGDPEYQRYDWPRRRKCKEGNLAYFYDHYGYDRYDFVVQMDADHVPAPGYLEAMLHPFVNPAVGYVSAPSICDANARQSWAARARLYAEASLHGSLQAGYSAGWAPLCIGSHYTVRTRALKDIGGLGPELAEDHSTSLLFNAAGWSGVHAVDAIAHGDGPATFSDAMTQEFQWSRSLVILLLTLTPKVLNRLTLKKKFEFLFAQLWYPLFSGVMLSAFLLPLEAIITGKPWVNINYVEFVLNSLAPALSGFLILFWIRNQGWLRPVRIPLFSWEIVLFQIARWPWVLWGTILAVLSVLRQVESDFRVTPKGSRSASPVPLRVIIPYFILSGTSAFLVLLGAKSRSSYGYYYFAIINAFMYLIFIIAVIYKHFDENPSES